MTKYAEAVERLVDLNDFLRRHSIPAPRTEFTSNIGEWKVMDELIRRGHSPTLQSGQYAVDILLDDGKGVEVKSAIMNSRFGGAWLFDNIQPQKFDFLVCVKMADDYSSVEYFVFAVDDIGEIPYRNQSDASDQTRLLRIFTDIDRAPTEQGRRINEMLDDYSDSWGKLR